MNSEIVNPIPDIAAPPAMCDMVSPGARAEGRNFAKMAEAPVIPTSLPSTRPAMMPQVSVDVEAAFRVSELSTTPALASAKIGTMMNAVYG